MALKPSSDLWNYFTNFVEEGLAECKLCKQRLKNNRSYNLKLHLKKLHTDRSEIEKYFEINVAENYAICKTCKQKLKNRLCNLRLHMRRSHAIEIVLPEDKAVKAPDSPQPYNEDQIKAVLTVAKRKMLEEAVGDNVKRAAQRLFVRINESTIIRCIMGLIVEDCVPLSLLRSKHLEAILKPMCEAISDKEGKLFKMDETVIERIISSVANYMRNDFSNDLHCRLLSLKIDTDLNAPVNTFCLSAQFITEGEIQKRILGIIKLENDNYDLKESHIKQTLYKFNIDSNQIISAFWDHTKQKYNKQIKSCEYLKEIQQLEMYPSVSVGDVKVQPYLGSVAQLCLMDFLKNSIIYNKFLDCRNIVKVINDEKYGYGELFKTNNLSLPQQDSPWRAGSTYKMMHDLLTARHLLKDIKFEKEEPAENYFVFNNQLWSFIESFCKSTSYLQKSILKYNSEELHNGDFYAQWLKCKLLTEKLLSAYSAQNEKNGMLAMMLTEVLKAIESRTSDLFSQERFAACLYLDPRFQRILDSKQKSSAVEYLKKLWCRAKLYIVDEPATNEEFQLFVDDEDAFLNEFLSHDLHAEDSGSSDVFHKIEDIKLIFQMVETNVLTFWKGHKKSDPEVYTLSTICFAVPASDIYDKMRYSNIYSLADYAGLSEFTKENLINLRVNSYALADAVAHLKLTDDNHSNASSGSDVESYDVSESDNSNTASTTIKSANKKASKTKAKVLSTSNET